MIVIIDYARFKFLVHATSSTWECSGYRYTRGFDPWKVNKELRPRRRTLNKRQATFVTKTIPQLCLLRNRDLLVTIVFYWSLDIEIAR